MSKFFVIINLLLLISINSISQTNPATARRDWYVGHYVGVLKDSTANISVPCNFDCYWTENYPVFSYPNDDSTITIPMGYNRFIVCVDSTIYINGNRFCTNAPNPISYGVLKADSSFLFIFTSSGGCVCSATVGSSHCDPGNLMVFHGKKTSSTPVSVYENILENSNAGIFPNPAQEYVNVLTLVEFDAIELYDVLGKNHKIVMTKTNDGYHIDLPENISPGIYFLQMKKENERITKKVMVKQRE